MRIPAFFLEPEGGKNSPFGCSFHGGTEIHGERESGFAMSCQIQCAFCEHSFDADPSGGGLLVPCPHCGKQNTAAAPPRAVPRMHIIRNASTLAGGKPCPKCKEPVDLQATICVHCGYNFETGKKMAKCRVSSDHRCLARLCGGVLILAVAVALHGQWSKIRLCATQVRASADRLIAARSAAVPEPAEVQPAPPEPPPRAPESVAPPPEDPRVAFEARKVQLAESIRRKLDATAPLYKPNDKVKVRRNNGQIVRGTLLRFVGEGTNRVAFVDTAEGVRKIPLLFLDWDSRARMDSGYREKYIRHMLNIRTSASTSGQPKGKP